MDLVSMAYAMGQSGAQGQQGNPLGAFLPLILMFAIFYFLLIRPQQKKAKQHREMLANLRKGDYVMTGGGLYGRIVDIKEDVLTVQLAEGLEVKVNRGYIAALANPEKEDKPQKKGKEKK